MHITYVSISMCTLRKGERDLTIAVSRALIAWSCKMADPATTMLSTAMSHFDEGRFAMAVQVLEAAVKDGLCKDGNLTALHLLGNCHEQLNQLPEARDCFLACVRLGFEKDWQNTVEVSCALEEEELELEQPLQQQQQGENKSSI